MLNRISYEIRSRGALEVTRLADGYIIAQASDGNFLTRAQVRRSTEFRNLVNQLRVGRYNQRRYAETGNRMALDLTSHPQGPLAQVLVALGMRLPTDTFAVGQSPKGHSATVQNYLRTEAYAQGWSGAA